MIILVTGGAGFIGSHLTERLLGRGDRVVALDNLNDYYDPRIKQHNLERARQLPGFTFIQGDILDTSLLKRIFNDYSFDVIVHLAARAGVRPSLEQPLLYEQVNCQGTLNLLEESRRRNIRRFVFASSSSVYGNVKTVPFREDARVDRPVSPYAASKAAGELYCHNYFHLYGISVTALRFFTVYGPRQRPDLAIYKFARLIQAGKPIPVFGDGTAARDYTFVTDTVSGVIACTQREIGYDIFNLGENQVVTLSRMIELLEQALGKKALIERLPLQLGDVPRTCANIDKARARLGYDPQVKIEEGIRRFGAWILANEF